MMSRDKAGNYIFQVGKEYRMKQNVNPVWPQNQTAKCTQTKKFEGVDNRSGLFNNGDDLRWWVANDSFEEVL